MRRTVLRRALALVIGALLCAGSPVLPVLPFTTCALAQYIPPVPEPYCAYCHGAGCEHCQPTVPVDDEPIIYHPDPEPPAPQPEPQPAPAPAPAPAPVPAPVPAVDPQRLFEESKEALLRAFEMPAALAVDAAALSEPGPVVTSGFAFGAGPPPAGMTEAEWNQASECQRQLDDLYSRLPLSAADAATAQELEKRRNALWQKAVSQPGMPDEEREQLRLRLHTLNPPNATVPSVTSETLKEWTTPPPPPAAGEPPAPAINPVASWLVSEFGVGQAVAAVEFGGEVLSDQIFEEHSFGDFLGVAKIAVAYKEGGVASAIAETADFLVGKLPIPQAGLAVEGGRQYANIVFQAQNKFMTEAMKAAGGEFDKDKFWSDFNGDLTVGQKAVKEWVGYGSN